MKTTREIIDQLTPAERVLWSAKIAACCAETNAEDALKEARRQLSLARRAKRHADRAFEHTPSGRAWVDSIIASMRAEMEAARAARAAA